jgi:hypothetical protein
MHFVQRLDSFEVTRVEQFFTWLGKGLESGELAYNQSGAMVHFVPEGMLLVSPAIFQAYAGKNEEDWMGVQRLLIKSGCALRTTEGSHIWRYQILSGKKPTGVMLNGVVIDAPEALSSEPLLLNPYLRLFDQTYSGRGAPPVARRDKESAMPFPDYEVVDYGVEFAPIVVACFVREHESLFMDWLDKNHIHFDVGMLGWLKQMARAHKRLTGLASLLPNTHEEPVSRLDWKQMGELLRRHRTASMEDGKWEQ